MFASLSSPPPIPFTFTSKSPSFQLLPRFSFLAPQYALRSQNPRRPINQSPLLAAPPTPETLAKSAIQRISDKLRNLGYVEQDGGGAAAADRPATGPGSAGEIFIPTPREIPVRRVGHSIDSSWSTPEHPVPEPGSGVIINRFSELWWRERKAAARARKDATVAADPPTVAELTIPPHELTRLRREGVRLEKRLKVGKAGITEGIVNGIHERWRRSELVKIKCEDLCRMNMKRTHAILERKTGGLVIWRSGSTLILYRGVDYKYPYYCIEESTKEVVDELSSTPSSSNEATSTHEANLLPTPSISSSAESVLTHSRSLVVGVGSPKKVRVQLEGELQLAKEADKLLDGLGPRFTDWWGCDPLPVDADLLPAVVPGFRKPFRLLPFGIKPKLTDQEMTILKRLGRPLPCHFALGRNKKLQGLAVSMIKLWEKCEIAKIAIKRGVQNTNSEMMAEELKQLTGGTLLSRDKEFFVFYRGKDFLPPAVSIALEERRTYESNKKNRTADKDLPLQGLCASESKLTLTAPPDEPKEGAAQNEASALERSLNSANLALQSMENRLSQAIEKKEMAEKSLSQLETSVKTSKIEADKEAISEEERYMLRKVGLRMQPFLLLGRRGVFDGTIENMHLHWKYRELVKLISKDRTIRNVEIAARLLEAESGGILVAIERVSKGYAIIIYRGKNYRRPATLRPTTLLNKKKAMKRSLEAQRYESLKLHVLKISRNLDEMKNQMGNDDSRDDDSVLVNNCQLSGGVVETYDESGFIEQEKKYSSEIEVEAYSASTMENIMVPNEMGYESSLNNVKQGKFIDLEKNGDDCFDSEVAPVSSSALADRRVYKDRSVEESHHEVPFKAAPLSNRERLILRKQALKMKKRPVLAVGRNNVISGVAKTIRTHFRKHALAIVNIKGRADGTSVPELIFELEQATGAVLVSREPNKVILYRGYGEGKEAPGGVQNKDAKGTVATGIVSPQLIEAIRIECGLQANT